MDDARQTYDAVVRELLLDTDADVEAADDGLLVKGRLFTFLDGAELVVELPEARSADLRRRGIVVPFVSAKGGASRNWVRVADRELWSELAREAHQFVGEPAVGRES
ncbi:hypothetical protein [Agromyces bauzanensis]